MFAIIKSGGKQYRVAEGDVLRLELLDADAGSTLELPALLVGGGDDVKVGTPTVDGASVTLEVLGHGRGPKIDIYKFKAKTNYRRHLGHRQDYTEVRITGISA
jgi:large subunit ribosomal protein L21